MAAPSGVTKPIEVFFSYAHADEALRDELGKHLRLMEREGLISRWHDRDITAGQEWATQIDTHLATAGLVLLLISADFMDSDYCTSVEMERAMQRHHHGDAVVIPIILRDVDWHSAPFGKLQALPKNAKPITSWPNQDEAFADVANGIRRTITKLAAGTSEVASPIPSASETSVTSTTYPGSLKLTVCQRLMQDWRQLADHVGMRPDDRARLTIGHEPQGVWEWLEARQRLAELPEALTAIGRHDLAEVLQQHQDKRVAEKHFDVALPEEVLAGLGWQETEVPHKLREMVVMELLRRAQLSEAQAATLLQLDRWELLEVMGRYRVPAIRMSQEELHQELARHLPADGQV